MVWLFFRDVVPKGVTNMDELSELLVQLAHKKWSPTELHMTLQNMEKKEYCSVKEDYASDSTTWPWYRFLTITIGTHAVTLKLPRQNREGIPVATCGIEISSRFTSEHYKILSLCILDLIGQT